MSGTIFILVVLSMSMSACHLYDKNENEESNQKSKFDWGKKDNALFIKGCVAKAKDRIGEELAYKYCSCMMSELENRYPTMDSAMTIWSNEQLLGELIGKCRDQ